ncbi:MAG: glycosyl hydrolase [Gemmatimonadota bacterium]|nr:glycosyl hydrolase [Gemmatimonadota bacterium]
MPTTRTRLTLALAIVLTPLALGAQQIPPSLYGALHWRNIGPFEGGRVEAVAGVPGNPSTFYFGAVNGGVWKTVDAGQTWESSWNGPDVGTIGALAVAPSDPNVIYAGTGEPDPRTDIATGDGVYRSTDAGRTWTDVGLRDAHQIGRIVVDPRDPDVLLVAAEGDLFKPSAERGVYRSADGGKSWTRTLYVNDSTGAVDLAMDPTNPRILFAVMWQVRRTPWSLVDGGAGSGLYRSADGGVTWTRLSGNGLPSGIWGRTSVSVGADGRHVYALINAHAGGLYRSDDGGGRWTLVNDDQNIRQRPWYYFQVRADPQDPNTVYLLNFFLYRSVDGGATISRLDPPHVDNHAIWIDPTAPQRIIEGNDGGATVTLDGGTHWSSESNQPTAQIYHVATDNQVPYRVYGAQQDRGTYSIASATNRGGISSQDWYDVAGGESGYVLPAPGAPDTVFAGSYFGDLTRWNRATGEAQDVTPWPENTEGHAAATVKYRFSWTSPLAFDPFQPYTLYSGSQYLLKTTDGGRSWTEISPDLTRNDKSKQQLSGGPITLDNVGAEYYDVIYTIAPSTLSKGLIWTGTDDGLIQLTRDGGAHWTNVTPRALPEWAHVELIDASTRDAGNAYAAVGARMLGNDAPYLFRTRDYGQSWTSIAAGLAGTVYFVREDPVRANLLYAGTEKGVYVSFDDGDHWQSLMLNLPHTSMRDLVVHGNDLVLATHGRGFWILDGIAPLRQAAASVAQAPAYLFKPNDAVRSPLGGGSRAATATAGGNAPGGALIDYYLGSAAAGPVTLEILDANGAVVNRYSNGAAEGRGRSLPAHAGGNRFVWPLDYAGPPALQVPGGPIFESGQPRTPAVVPGQYTVRLTVAGKSYTQPLTVTLDPRIGATPADLARQLDLMQRINAALTDDHEAFNQIAGLRQQLQGVASRLAADSSMRAVVDSARALDVRADTLSVKFFQYRAKAAKWLFMNYPIQLNAKFVSLENSVGGSDDAPTAQDEANFKTLRATLDARLADWRAMQQRDVAALNALMRQHGIGPVYVGPQLQP